MSHYAAVTTALLLGAMALPGITHAQATDCDRACLQGLADQVLNSIAANAPDTLPLTRDYAATENSVPSALNMMVIWRTATAVAGRYYAIDSTSKQVFFQTSVSEGPNAAFVYGRIKADGKQISEIELYENRSRGQGGFQFGPEGPANLPVEWTRAVKAKSLLSRDDLLTVGRSVFDTKFSSPAASTDCVLMENGKIVAEHADVAAQVGSGGKKTAAAKPKGKAFTANADGTVPIPCGSPPGRPTDPRARTPIVDEVQGVVVAMAVVKGVTWPYLATNPTESAFVPDAMTEPYSNMLKGQLAAGMQVSVAMKPMPATGAVFQPMRVYDGQLQGMQLLVNIGAPGSHSPWVSE